MQRSWPVFLQGIRIQAGSLESDSTAHFIGGQNYMRRLVGFQKKEESAEQ